MSKIALKYKIGKEQVQQLIDLYANYLAKAETSNEHEVLLFSIMQDMYARMVQLTKAAAVNCILKLTDTEAIAFYQQWSTCDISAWRYADLIVRKLLQAIDKKAKQYTRSAR